MDAQQDKELSGDLHAVVIAHCEDLERSVPTLREHRLGPVADEFLKASAELRAALATSPQLPVAEQPAGQASLIDALHKKAAHCESFRATEKNEHLERIYLGMRDGLNMAAGIVSEHFAAAPHSPVAQMSGDVVEECMALAHQWAIAAYHKGLGKEFADFDEIRRELKSKLLTVASRASNAAVQDAPTSKVENFLAMAKVWVERDGGNMDDALSWMYSDKSAATVQPSNAVQDEWKLAVDHELVQMQSTADSYAKPSDAIRDLIGFHVEVATNPQCNGGLSLQPAAAMPPVVQAPIPEILFDGYAVYSELTEKERADVVPKSVANVLDAIVRVMRRNGAAPAAIDVRDAALEYERSNFESTFAPKTIGGREFMRRDSKGNYRNPSTQSAWQGWQARALQSPPQTGKEVES